MRQILVPMAACALGAGFLVGCSDVTVQTDNGTGGTPGIGGSGGRVINCTDGDGDTVCDIDDVCAGHDDLTDADGDDIPDACDCDHVGPTCAADAACAEHTSGATCTCNAGYEGDGTTCTLIDCGALTSPSDGSVSTPETRFGSTATYSCDVGYLLQGDATRACEQEGWSGEAPLCTIRDCGPLPALANGSVLAPVTTFGAVATYSCNGSHRLFGATTNRCGADGQWIGAPPTCREVLTCACGGDYTEGERVRATVANPSNANALPLGNLGTVIAGSTGAPPILIEWDDWENGHNGNCAAAGCGDCVASGTSRRYVLCNEIETLQLTCGCAGSFRAGDRVVALVDDPASATDLPMGTTGTVIAGSSDTLGVLVEWDDWENGHGGNCGPSVCGDCVASGSSRWYVECNAVGLAP